MSNKILFALIAALLVLLTLGATGCEAMPTLDATPPLPEKVATAVTPTPTPMPATTPETSSQAPAPDRRKIENALKIAGLAGGIVSANTGDTLTLRTGRQPQQIQTNATTLVAIPGKSDATVADIRVGDRVLADLDASGTTATFVLALPADTARENLLAAAILANRGASFAVRTRGGNRALHTDATTSVIDITGAQPTPVSPGDLKQGNAILAIGQANGEHFDAQLIIVLGQDARALLSK